MVMELLRMGQSSVLFHVENCTINSSHSAIYLSNQETDDPNTLTVDEGTYSSTDTPFELKKTNVTIKTLPSNLFGARSKIYFQ